jgi:hypothetical protein
VVHAAAAEERVAVVDDGRAHHADRAAGGAGTA